MHLNIERQAKTKKLLTKSATYMHLNMERHVSDFEHCLLETGPLDFETQVHYPILPRG